MAAAAKQLFPLIRVYPMTQTHTRADGVHSSYESSLCIFPTLFFFYNKIAY